MDPRVMGSWFFYLSHENENKDSLSRAPVAHAYNSSYSGGRDQEDHSSEPVQIVRETLSQKTLHKKGLVEWLKV
jgi:hypothetical protein